MDIITDMLFSIYDISLEYNSTTDFTSGQTAIMSDLPMRTMKQIRQQNLVDIFLKG